jgi:hypothetical protein
MGFSGVTGSSDRAMSSILHYGLAEKAAKGEIRVTDLALKILHPESVEERRAALHEAAFAPDLFQELRQRYRGSPPTLSNLESFLSRANFATAAIGPAAKAYLETCRFLQQEGAYESDSAPRSDDGESGASHEPERPTVMSTPSPQQVAPPPAAPAQGATRPPEALPSTHRRDVFSLEEGDVTITLPSALSEDSYEDLKDWLELVVRKTRRSVSKAATKSEEQPEAGLPDKGDTDDLIG